MKCLANIFAIFFPSENNHVNSTCMLIKLRPWIPLNLGKGKCQLWPNCHEIHLYMELLLSLHFWETLGLTPHSAMFQLYGENFGVQELLPNPVWQTRRSQHATCLHREHAKCLYRELWCTGTLTKSCMTETKISTCHVFIPGLSFFSPTSPHPDPGAMLVWNMWIYMYIFWYYFYGRGWLWWSG